jgi:hypothetical protein
MGCPAENNGHSVAMRASLRQPNETTGEELLQIVEHLFKH